MKDMHTHQCMWHRSTKVIAYESSRMPEYEIFTRTKISETTEDTTVILEILESQ